MVTAAANSSIAYLVKKQKRYYRSNNRRTMGTGDSVFIEQSGKGHIENNS